MSDDGHGGGWQIDKRISYGHLLTTLTVLISVFIWSMRLETRVLLSEQMIISSEKRHEQTTAIFEKRMAFMETAIEEHQKELLRKIEKVDERMASHIEKQAERNHP